MTNWPEPEVSRPIQRIEERPRDEVGTGLYVGSQRWSEMLFLHFRADDPSQLERRLPRGVELDLHDGAAWVSIVAFRTDMSAPRIGAKALARSWYEVNVRTYVKQARTGDPGIVILSADTTSRWFRRVSRMLGVVAHDADVVSRVANGGTGEYVLDRRGGGAHLRVDYERGEHLGTGAIDPVDAFTVERYRLFMERAAMLLVLGVRHPRMDLARVRVTTCESDLLKSAGVDADGSPALAHYSDGVTAELLVLPPVTGSAADRARPRGRPLRPRPA